jgi:hypothetical protein
VGKGIGSFDSFDFIGLEDIVVDHGKSDTNDYTYIDFKVRLRAKEGTIFGQETIICERSKFVKVHDDA